MAAPTSAATGDHVKLGAAAIAEFIDDREFGRERQLPNGTERDMIQDAIEGFVTYEQWLPFEHDEVELIAGLRAAASLIDASPATAGDLLTGAADALTELGQRLALQRHSREIMYEGLILQGEALKQAQLAAGHASKHEKQPIANGGADPDEGGEPPTAAHPEALARYSVKFWKRSVTSDRMSIEVAAASPEAARARVLAWGKGEVELTAAEEMTETLEREELHDSSFDRLLDADEPNAVTLIADDPSV